MRVLWFSFALLAVDQVSKTLVHRLMVPGQSIPVLGDLLKLTYTTNPGMAFGLEIGPKLFLSIFSIVATIALVAYLWAIRDAPWGYRFSIAAVVGGALGNVVDRTFYGVIYGHGPLFHGEVIDFIHIDLWRGWVDVPVLGPQFVALFPIWNVADMAIVLGVVAVLLTHRQLHEHVEAKRSDDPTATSDAAADPPPEAAAVDGTGAPPAGLDAVDGAEVGETPARDGGA